MKLAILASLAASAAAFAPAKVAQTSLRQARTEGGGHEGGGRHHGQGKDSHGVADQEQKPSHL